MKKSWPLEDLDCANCAAKMEDAMAKLPGVTKVRVDFFHQTLTLEAPDEIYNEVLAQVVACGKKVEPDCRIITDGSKSKAGEHHQHHHDHEHEHEDGCCCGHGHHHHDDDDVMTIITITTIAIAVTTISIITSMSMWRNMMKRKGRARSSSSVRP